MASFLHNYMLTVTLLERVFKYLSNDTSFAMVSRYVLIKWSTIYSYPCSYFQALLLTLVVLNHKKKQDCSNSQVAINQISLKTLRTNSLGEGLWTIKASHMKDLLYKYQIFIIFNFNIFHDIKFKLRKEQLHL